MNSRFLARHNVVRCVAFLRQRGSNTNFVRRLRILAPNAASEFSTSQRRYTTQAQPASSDDAKKQGKTIEKREFQAEITMLLDIVAKALYSDKEVFIRELISNSSDALEKSRYNSLAATQTPDTQRPLEIQVSTDKILRLFSIADNGIGMTKQELSDNLGTIARSGSKLFMKEMQDRGQASVDSIIGQFGVGFYSAFMVAEKVEVFTHSSQDPSNGYHWVSDGRGTYEISAAEEPLPVGTKIVVHLKADAAEFADDRRVEEIIRKYSNFVNAAILLNGQRLNTVQAIWNLDPKEITSDMHDEFYKFITHQKHDQPRYCLHYKTDAPLNVRALLYVPQTKPSTFDLGSTSQATGVALYSRRVLIQSKTNDVLPSWLRFLRGCVDSEDIPLNLSRELLQQTAVLNRLRATLTARVLKFFQDQMKRDREKYERFFDDFGIYFSECIVRSTEQQEKESVAKMLLYESSAQRAGVRVTLDEYCTRMQAGQRDIFFLAAPSRQLAETSPYFEAIRAKNYEVLFCYAPVDELVLMQLAQFDRKNLTSVEKAVRQDVGSGDEVKKVDAPEDAQALKKEELEGFMAWIKETLGKTVSQVKSTTRLSQASSHACFVTVEEMAVARHLIRNATSLQQMPVEQRYAILQPSLEINATHPVIKKLNELRATDEALAKLVLEQIFENAMATAGLVEDSRALVGKMNALIEKLLVGEKSAAVHDDKSAVHDDKSGSAQN